MSPSPRGGSIGTRAPAVPGSCAGSGCAESERERLKCVSVRPGPGGREGRSFPFSPPERAWPFNDGGRMIRRDVGAALVLAVGLLGCASKPKEAVAAAGHAIVLPFIENDYQKALTTAREASLPV